MTAFDEAFQILKQNFRISNLGPPYGKPEFGDEEARQAEMEDAERAAIMAEGVPEMPRPRGAPRPGDPRLRGSRRSDAPPNSEGFPKYFNSDIEPTGIAIHDSAHNQPRPKYPRDIFGKAWDFLKADESYTGQPKFGGNQKQPLDMHEYPPGSGNFMTLQDMLIARNADARKNMQNMTPKPRPTGGNTYDKRPSGWQ